MIRFAKTGFVAVFLALAASVVACGGGGGSPGGEPASEGEALIVYSGRGENLIGPILDRFSAESGIEVKVRYGATSELAATILEEGQASPADVFVAQDAGALGAVAAAGRFRTLPEDVLALLPARFAAPDGLWVGLSGRARSVVYNTERVRREDLPRSLEAMTDPRYRGQFGVAPANGSFQAHMAVYGVVEGTEKLDELLAGMAANEPKRYPKNSAIVEAVVAGEVDWGLVNHYYLWRVLSERPDAPGANFFMPEGAASGFVNIAGAGVLGASDAAVDLVRFLLSKEAQEYFASETYEYPLIEAVAPSVELPDLAGLATPEVDFGSVSEALADTLTRINDSGLLAGS